MGPSNPGGAVIDPFYQGDR